MVAEDFSAQIALCKARNVPKPAALRDLTAAVQS